MVHPANAAIAGAPVTLINVETGAVRPGSGHGWPKSVLRNAMFRQPPALTLVMVEQRYGMPLDRIGRNCQDRSWRAEK